MSKSANRRKGRSRRSAGKSFSLLPWAVAAVALVGIVAIVSPHGASGQHPTPRADAATTQARQIMPASTYASYPRIAEVYREAALVPQVLDGIYCYCDCERNMGHYSLLDCYKSDHAAGCDVCLSEGALAYRMHQEGKTLDQIRSAVDAAYRM